MTPDFLRLLGAACILGSFYFMFLIVRHERRSRRHRHQAMEIAHRTHDGPCMVFWADQCSDDAEIGTVWISSRALTDDERWLAYDLIDSGHATEGIMAPLGLRRVDRPENETKPGE